MATCTEPVGGFEINNVEPKNMPKYIKHDVWGQEWMMLNYDSGATLTALPVSVAGNLPLEKQSEIPSRFRSNHSKLGQNRDEVDG